jgi:predicted metal-dependent enzyme (double-stranded beta helix superfamily)
MNQQDVAGARHQAVEAARAEAKALLAGGVTIPALASVRDLLIRLAARTELFPEADFTPHDTATGATFRLGEDADGGFAMYAVAMPLGNKTPPHDHTTWAVIAGMRGEEQNLFFTRADDGSAPGHGTLTHVATLPVRQGHGITMLPDGIHAVHCAAEGPLLALHLYGKSLEAMPDRVSYNTEAGTYKTFGPPRNFQ